MDYSNSKGMRLVNSVADIFRKVSYLVVGVSVVVYSRPEPPLGDRGSLSAHSGGVWRVSVRSAVWASVKQTVDEGRH